MTDADADAILTLWFETLSPADWWRGGAAVDDAIASRFGELHATLSSQGAEGDAARAACERTARTCLAGILVLDQFSRNVHRGDPRAFASDAVARALSDFGLARGWDKAFAPMRRAFFYMPYMHSENADDQARSVALFAALDHDNHLHHAQTHADVIARFGRYPTRNAVLGRVSTPEELAYLAEQKGAV